MLAVEWDQLGFLGSFAVGLLVGIVVTIRLTKILAEYLRRERDRD